MYTQRDTAASGPTHQDLHRLLGTLPVSLLDARDVAAGLDTTPEQAEALLADLFDAGMLTEPDPESRAGDGTYRLHDAVRDHARAQVHAHHQEQHNRILQRWLTWQLTAARAARQFIAPHHHLPASHPVPAPRPGIPFDDRHGALEWLTTHRHGLLAAVTAAARARMDQLCVALILELTVAAPRLGDPQQWLRAHETALAAANRSANPAQLLAILTACGAARRTAGRFAEALVILRAACERTEAAAQHNPSLTWLWGQALHEHGATQRRTGTVYDAYAATLTLQQALRVQQRDPAAAHGPAARCAMARTRIELALALHRTGLPRTAAEHLTTAARELMELREPFDAARASAYRALMAPATGSPAEPDLLLAQTRTVFRTLGEPVWAARCLEFRGRIAAHRAQRAATQAKDPRLQRDPRQRRHAQHLRGTAAQQWRAAARDLEQAAQDLDDLGCTDQARRLRRDATRAANSSA